VFEALRLFDEARLRTDVVRGQYRGYKAEENVVSDSTMETYFRMTAYIDNGRWKGTPFIMEVYHADIGAVAHPAVDGV